MQQLLQPVVTAMGYELVGVEFHANGGRGLLRVYIDRESGVGLEDCQRVSHQISGVLDLEDPISGAYTLEVSSPGLDRPLFEESHYRRFAGHRVRIHLALPRDGRRRLTGTLKGVREGSVVVEVEGDEILVPLDSIDRARLVPQFQAGSGERRST
ncbi:MAG: ribosome maturation factor RimP [Pseudomonadota bacterium]|nr:ribosome maturation factor RimP [Pseudomonadota bacterium]